MSELYAILPRVIADENGHPVKGSKAVWKDQLKKRYPGPMAQVVTDILPTDWKADIVTLDVMFFFNCKPLRNTRIISDYSMFLFNIFLLPHYQAQVNEVHMDDSLASASSHQHIKFNPSTDIATISWSSFIACRQCKYSTIETIGLSFLQSTRLQLRPGQVLYLSGCFGNKYFHPVWQSYAFPVTSLTS